MCEFFNFDPVKWVRRCIEHGFDAEEAEAWEKRWRPALTPSGWGKRKGITELDEPALRDLLAILYEASGVFAAKTSVCIVGDKWPWYLRIIKLMRSRFPDARFIYSVRDPRAVWASFRGREGSDYADRALQEILDLDQIYREFKDCAAFALVRYEDLLQDAESTMARLLRFLGADATGRGWNFDLASDPRPLRWYTAPLALHTLETSRINAWREEVSRSDCRKIVSISQEYLEEYGYSSESSETSIHCIQSAPSSLASVPMNEHSVTDLSKSLRDPRSASGFEPRFYPLADGHDAVATDSERSLDWVMREFLALYYYINRCANALADLRSLPRSQERRQMEAKIVGELNRYLERREALEKKFYRFGYCIRPVLEKGLVVDLQFLGQSMVKRFGGKLGVLQFSIDGEEF